MKKILKKYFIPHEHNNFRPHFFHEISIIFLSLSVVILLGLAFLYTSLVSKTNFLALIFPSVLVDLTNKDRAENNIQQLSINPVLTEAARRKAEHMAQNSYFAHYSPDGKSPWFWFGEVGYTYTYAGENLAVHFSDSQDVEVAWMASPGHRANILNKNFTEIGIATAKGYFDGVETTFVVEMFGNPAKKKVKPTAPAISIRNDPPVTSNIKGAEVEAQVKIVKEDNMFIAVENSEFEQTAPESKSAIYASKLERALLAPKDFFTYLYVILASIVMLALFLDLFIEMERQHPRHILYACFLLLLIGLSLYIEREFIFSQVLVV